MRELDKIKAYIAQRGCCCADGLVENFYLSLKTKPALFLLGCSNMDMTRLPRLFAGAVGASAENGRYLQLAVKPDWMDSSDLFGWLNLEGKFVPGVMIDFMKAAREDPGHPYFLCMDQMILSRAEYYLRDMLNAIDSREAETKLPYVPTVYYGRDQAAWDTYGEIPLLHNLYIIATVNLDETSLPLNQKLLDRVNTLSVMPSDLYGEETGLLPGEELYNDFLLTRYCRLDQYEGSLDSYMEAFEQINQILLEAKAYLSFKIRNDAILYLLHNRHTGALPEAAAMDHILCQKVLPRLQGAAGLIRPALENLQQFARTRGYEKTAARISGMLSQCDREGYASCWNMTQNLEL